MIALKNPKSPVAEAFRTLRTNIQFSNIDKDIKTIIVTSAIPREGKSTVISNLASTMAQADKKVLIVDCDFRKPVLHKRFKISNLQGLTNILMGDKSLLEAIVQHDDLKNLNILPSGPIPPNPAELLGSNKMKEFLGMIKKEFDMVLIDTPPVGLVTDAAVLSTSVDGVLLVIAAEQTDIDIVKKGKESLEKVNANIMGVVLNKVPLTSRLYSKYGYYKYYG